MHEIQFFCNFFLASTPMLTIFSGNCYRPNRKLIRKKKCVSCLRDQDTGVFVSWTKWTPFHVLLWESSLFGVKSCSSTRVSISLLLKGPLLLVNGTTNGVQSVQIFWTLYYIVSLRYLYVLILNLHDSCLLLLCKAFITWNFVKRTYLWYYCVHMTFF